jgi:hypothetical protein
MFATLELFLECLAEENVKFKVKEIDAVYFE